MENEHKFKDKSVMPCCKWQQGYDYVQNSRQGSMNKTHAVTLWSSLVLTN
jgi:hypothetical protein